MKDGVIHQVGPPSEIYDRPADRFVAGFVGTPPMNLLEGDVRGTNFTSSSGAVFTAPVGTAEGAAVLGIRPEAIRLSHNGGVSATVMSIERLGDRMDVVFDIDGTSMIGRCEPSELIEGQPATITFDVTHVFDAGDCGARRGKGG
jgi:multiple sugar transport system ATP-binding protein